MDNATDAETSSKWLLDTLHHYVPESILRIYNLDRKKNRQSHNPKRLTDFLELYMEAEVETREQKKDVEGAAETGTIQASPAVAGPEKQRYGAQKEVKGPEENCCYCKGSHPI